jgi:hypothetical protein
MRSRLGAVGASIYLLGFACAAAYPLFDHRTFAGLPAVLLGLPWIDYFSTEWFLVAIALNALIIYFLLAALSFLFASLRRSKMWNRGVD